MGLQTVAAADNTLNSSWRAVVLSDDAPAPRSATQLSHAKSIAGQRQTPHRNFGTNSAS